MPATRRRPTSHPARSSPGDLGDEPRLVAFAVGCDDIDAAVAALRAAGMTGAGDPFGMARQRPDGAVLSWRLAFVGGRVGGATPFLIAWDSGGSPAYDAPAGGQLVTLRAAEPDPTQARRVLEVLGVDVLIESSPTTRLEATITTPSGRPLTLT